MMAAIAASQNPNCQVHLFERQSRVGRKLLSTGNGRCNLSNANAGPAAYHGAEPEFAVPALRHLDAEATVRLFHALGLSTVQEESGRVYPWSDQAGSVLDVLRFALLRKNIHTHLPWDITKVRREASGFRLDGGPEPFHCDKLIVACGGLAGTALGGSMSGYQLLKSMGHKCSRLRPALVQVKSSYPRCASLKGIRAVAAIEIKADGRTVAQNYGEVQFTQYGLSGPAIFEVSRHVCTHNARWCCVLDLLPHMTINDLLRHLEARRELCPSLETGDIFNGTVHNRLGRLLVQEAGIPLNLPLSEISSRELENLAAQCKSLELTLTEPMGMDSAQVTAGGVLTEGFDPNTMESRLCPGLYACGEVLDIDGDCGGFNLQWAWSSGHLAGTCAGEVAL